MVYAVCDNVSPSIAHEIRDLIYPSLSQYVNISQIKLRENEKCVIAVEIDATPYCYGIKKKAGNNETAYQFFIRNGSSEPITPIGLNMLIPAKAPPMGNHISKRSARHHKTSKSIPAQ